MKSFWWKCEWCEGMEPCIQYRWRGQTLTKAPPKKCLKCGKCSWELVDFMGILKDATNLLRKEALG